MWTGNLAHLHHVKEKMLYGMHWFICHISITRNPSTKASCSSYTSKRNGTRPFIACDTCIFIGMRFKSTSSPLAGDDSMLKFPHVFFPCGLHIRLFKYYKHVNCMDDYHMNHHLDAQIKMKDMRIASNTRLTILTLACAGVVFQTTAYARKVWHGKDMGFSIPDWLEGTWSTILGKGERGHHDHLMPNKTIQANGSTNSGVLGLWRDRREKEW